MLAAQEEEEGSAADGTSSPSTLSQLRAERIWSQPKWKAVRAEEEEKAEWQGEQGRRVECLWLPFFASDDPREEEEAHREAGLSSSTPAQVRAEGRRRATSDACE